MDAMTQLAVRTILLLLLTAGAAQAQIVAPPVPSIIPPPPPPSAPPPPKIEVPEVPKMDNPPPSKAVPAQRRSSYHDRVVGCLTDDVALRLTPTERVAYSRACANGRD
jgi:hypothetical protein